MKKYRDDEEYIEQEYNTHSVPEPEFGCGFCWDKKRQREKEIFSLDSANNMRVCVYCPYCGRTLGEENG